MTISQNAEELNPIGQAAMSDPMANYKLNLQTGMATNLRTAWALFDGSLLIPAVWNPLSEPYHPRGRPSQ